MAVRAFSCDLSDRPAKVRVLKRLHREMAGISGASPVYAAKFNGGRWRTSRARRRNSPEICIAAPILESTNRRFLPQPKAKQTYGFFPFGINMLSGVRGGLVGPLVKSAYVELTGNARPADVLGPEEARDFSVAAEQQVGRGSCGPIGVGRNRAEGIA